jgi:hypothetical protein
MARFVHIEYPVQHGGVVRFERGLQALGSFNAVHAALHVLAFIGSPVTRAAAAVRASVAAASEARRQREEDRKLWNLALTDARVMADLSRAMSQDALRDTRGYF